MAQKKKRTTYFRRQLSISEDDPRNKAAVEWMLKQDNLNASLVYLARRAVREYGMNDLIDSLLDRADLIDANLEASVHAVRQQRKDVMTSSLPENLNLTAEEANKASDTKSTSNESTSGATNANSEPASQPAKKDKKKANGPKSSSDNDWRSKM